MAKQKKEFTKNAKKYLFLKILLITFLISIFLELVFVFYLNSSRVKNLNNNATKTQTSNLQEKLGSKNNLEKWENIIKDIGPQKAYEKFQEENSGLKIGEQHANAHVFGKALYNATGLKGVSYCDNSFNFGCYHSFLGTAIREEGLGTVYELNKACIDNLKSQSLGCQHGIGHGIIANIGYKYDDLVQSLKICETLPFNDSIGGCYGGVFMEYNFQTMLDVDGTTRPLEENNVLFPCNNLSSEFETPCFYWQAQWWATVLKGDVNEKYKNIGIICKDVVEENNRKQCYLGAGNIAGEFTEYNPQETINLCKNLAEEYNIEAEVLCRAGAGGAYLAIPSKKNIASELCQGLEQKDKITCFKLASIPL